MRSRRQRMRIRRFCANGGLETVFQPMVELGSKHRVALEALTRFPNEARTTLEWFADASELGVGADLELAAVRSALQHLVDIPPDTLLAINVSAVVAVSDEFFELVAPTADRLIIELTEHEPVEDYEALRSALTRLRRRGARIAIDDVGAGFASLRHIVRLSPDIIKLDLSLTHEIETDASSRAATCALIDLADRTGAMVTAEGIETEGTLEVLCALGVDHGQGYLLGRPEPLLRRPEPLARAS
jgi:EAL domain-containing protein (putative c-di-GMP-specific phosphodiesterase class I)